MKTFYKILMLVMFGFFTTMSFAQINNQVLTNQIPSEECGTESYMTPQQRSIYLQTRDARNSWEKAETTLDFPIQFHIVRLSNGLGGFDPLLLPSVMNDINSEYINSNMQFYECATVNFIDDSGNFYFNSTNKSSFSTTHNVSNVINVYFFFRIVNTNNEEICGQASFPWSTGTHSIIMKNNCYDVSMVHEMGHFYSLWHTHQGYFRG